MSRAEFRDREPSPVHVYPHGGLHPQLQACPRSGRAARRRGLREMRRQIIGAVSAEEFANLHAAYQHAATTL